MGPNGYGSRILQMDNANPFNMNPLLIFLDLFGHTGVYFDILKYFGSIWIRLTLMQILKPIIIDFVNIIGHVYTDWNTVLKFNFNCLLEKTDKTVKEVVLDYLMFSFVS